MAFCVNCGTQLPQGAKFCPTCGTPLNGNPTVSNQTQQSPAAFTNCPLCGAPIGSFAAKCPSCGMEINNGVRASACQLLCERLDEIEASRPQKKGSGSISSILKSIFTDEDLSPTDQRKADLISHFILPNNKADIMEFIVLAQARIQACRKLSEDSEDEYVSFVQDELAVVWETKLEQTIKKARLVLSDDPDFLELENDYQMQKRRDKGVCQYCGGKFKGVFRKICLSCGKEKDY